MQKTKKLQFINYPFSVDCKRDEIFFGAAPMEQQSAYIAEQAAKLGISPSEYIHRYLKVQSQPIDEG